MGSNWLFLVFFDSFVSYFLGVWKSRMCFETVWMSTKS